MRFLLYCHNAVGLGHIVRTGKIAETLRKMDPNLDVLVVTGARFSLPGIFPPDVSYIKLPSARLDWIDGQATPFAVDLSLPFEELVSLRSKIIAAVVETYQPDIWLVDHNPAGFYSELSLAIENFHVAVPQGKLVLGMRGVAFGKNDQIAYFKRYEAILTHYYDHILVYVDPDVLNIDDALSRYPEIIGKVSYTGYITRVTGQKQRKQKQGFPSIIVAVGSGGVGFPVIEAVLHIMPQVQANFTVVAGPYMPVQQASHIEKMINDLGVSEKVHFFRFLPDLPNLLGDADLFIGRAGYNTLTDIMGSRIPAICIPYETEMGDQMEHLTHIAQKINIKIIREKDLSEMNLLTAVYEMLSVTNGALPIPIQLDGANKAAEIIIDIAQRGHRSLENRL